MLNFPQLKPFICKLNTVCIKGVLKELYQGMPAIIHVNFVNVLNVPKSPTTNCCCNQISRANPTIYEYLLAPPSIYTIYISTVENNKKVIHLLRQITGSSRG